VSADAPGPEPAEAGPFAEQVDERTARTDWRASVLGTILCAAAIGAWLIVSSAVLDYEEPAAAVIWGVLIVFLSLLRLLVAARSQILALATMAAGALTIVSPFVAGERGGPTVEMVVLGGAVILLSLVGLAVSGEAQIRSRG
jgi:hypothetical protein